MAAMHRFFSHLAAVSCFMVLVAFAGCEPSNSGSGIPTVRGADETKRLKVVCTTTLIADLVSRIGGQHVEVKSLMGAGVDPHLYKPSTRDVQTLSNADLVLYQGLLLEGKMQEIFEKLTASGNCVALAEGFPEEALLQADHAPDPHVWFDPELWMVIARNACETLARHDAAHAADYQAATESYLQELQALDTWCEERIAEISEERRVLVTAHNAYRYFGKAYGVEVRSIQGVSTESEPSLAVINELVELLSTRDIPAVFTETSVSDANLRALVEGCAARGKTVSIGGELYSDSLGSSDEPTGTYLGMMRHNVNTIVNALK